MTVKKGMKIPVFFYGTFMSATVLCDHGIDVSDTIPARLLDFELMIKPRVNLKRSANTLVFGGITYVSHVDIERLYAGLRKTFNIQYFPHPVTAIIQNDRMISALCYISENILDADPDILYLNDLSRCAAEVGAPQNYIDHIYSFRKA